MLIGLAMFAFIIWGAYRVISYLSQIFTTLNPNIAIAVIAGSTTVVASTLAIVLARYFEAKKEREVAHRDKKVELYNEFLKKLFEIFAGSVEGRPKQEELVPFLREIQRKLVLWSGPNVIKSYATWHKELTSQPKRPKAKSMIKMIDFFLALRKDLGHSNKGIKREYLMRFMLKHPDLLMRMFREKPEVTFAEIAKAEEKLK